MVKTDKILFVENLAEKLGGVKVAAIVNYTNLTAGQMSQVREELKELAGVEFAVVKNTLFKKALQKAGIKPEDDFEEKIQGQSALVICQEDEVTPLSVLAKLAKTMGSLEFKLGVMGGRILTAETLTTLAKLPSREVLLVRVVGGISRPLSGLVYSLNWNLMKLIMVIKKMTEDKEGGEG